MKIAFLSMKLPIYGKFSLPMKCLINEMSYPWISFSMNCPMDECFIYEMSYPWISFSMKCAVFEMSKYKKSFYEMSQHLGVSMILLKCVSGFYECWNCYFSKMHMIYKTVKFTKLCTSFLQAFLQAFLTFQL